MTIRDQLLANSFLECHGNIFYEKSLCRDNHFEQTYLELRSRENRILPDDVVEGLPDLKDSHPNKMEWEMRKSSLSHVLGYLKRDGAKRVLELGCGNGWFSRRIAAALKAEVCGVDINKIELVQAGKVFGSDENLVFAYADILGPCFQPNMFDTIVLGSSVQYFQNLEILFARLFDLLVSNGRIYIVDSPFYCSRQEAEEAKQRSIKHFYSLNIPGMAERYFHHTFDELRRFNYKMLYDPKSIISRLRRKLLRMPLSVFPLICIRKEESQVS
jgi:SAM-dependent methyltransferase